MGSRRIARIFSLTVIIAVVISLINLSLGLYCYYSNSEEPIPVNGEPVDFLASALVDIEYDEATCMMVVDRTIILQVSIKEGQITSL